MDDSSDLRKLCGIMNPACLRRFGVMLAVTTALLAAARADPTVQVLFKAGDDPRWAAADWDDHEWQNIPVNRIPARAGPFWLRVHTARGRVAPRSNQFGCDFLSWPEDRAVDGLFISAVFSFDLYWDGQLLARSGRVGSSRATEEPGVLRHFIRVPDESLKSAEHVIALRMSSYGYNFPGADRFGLALMPVPLTAYLINYEHLATVPLMLGAASLVVAAVALVMFLAADRRRTLLVCHVLSVALALFYGLIAFPFIFNVSYVWIAPRYIAITALATVISVLLPWLVAEHLMVLRRGQWLLALIPLLIAAWFSSYLYEIKTLWVCRAMLVVTAGIVAVGIWRRRSGARWMIVIPLGGLPLVRTAPVLFLDPSFFVFLEVMIFAVFARLGLQIRAERQRARELVLTAARLETELLKRNIQPHFLLNTLATIVEMIEQTPRNAVTLIEALADEFRILARVSGEKLVPIAQEIELCRAHLEIMSLRKGVRCSLTTYGIDPTAPVPPALFHTLIENGLTHLMPRDGEQTFELKASRGSGVVRYVLIARGVEAGHLPATGTGTGTRYVQARLEESFPERWWLDAGPVPGGWQTIIEMRDDPAAVTAAPATLAPLPLNTPA